MTEPAGAYTAYSYLPDGAIPRFELAPEFGRVPPYAAGLSAAEGGATSMIDVSDGLVADVGHLAIDSGVARMAIASGPSAVS